jgi:hypothetical protein
MQIGTAGNSTGRELRIAALDVIFKEFNPHSQTRSI